MTPRSPRFFFSTKSPRKPLKTLLDEALLRGGTDNVTVIVASYQIPMVPKQDVPVR